jgi:hypothetical protein
VRKGGGRCGAPASGTSGPGDLIATMVDDEVTYDLIEGTFEAKAAPVRVGFIVDGKRVTFGALVPVVILRRGTHHTLAEEA